MFLNSGKKVPRMKVFLCALMITVATCSAGFIGFNSASAGGDVEYIMQNRQTRTDKFLPQHPQFESIPDIQSLPIDDIMTIRKIRNDGSTTAGNPSDGDSGGYVGGGGAGFGGPMETHKSLMIFDGFERNGRLFDSYGVPITSSGYH